MSKCLNELTFEEIIKNDIEKCRKCFEDRYDYDTYEEKNPYGDTWATTSVEIKDESIERCQEEFKESFDDYETVRDFVIDYLLEDDDFLEKIKELVKG